MYYSPLLTDYYQLTMGYGYWRLGLHEQEAVYHLFFRRNPSQGDYVMASGLHAVVDLLENFAFSNEDIDFLKTQYGAAFPKEFLDYLKTLRFTGDVDAVAEGTLVFPNVPILRIKAPLLLCQLLETPIINAINFSSAVSTMASRMRTQVNFRKLFEFGLRRAQGPDGGLTASRAAYVGGFDATSNVLAGKLYGTPLVGTMSHAWIMSFENEIAAFRYYAQWMPDNVVLLLDTYNTMQGVAHAITVGHELKEKGYQLKGVRLDSGDLSVLSKKVRQQLDAAGLSDVKIYVSGDLSELKIQALIAAQAPVDGFGVGTALSTSATQPALDMVYKLGAIKRNDAWEYKLKCSDNRLKTSDPGILQARRFMHQDKWVRDVIYDEMIGLNEDVSASELLMQPVFQKGVFVGKTASLTDIRARGLSSVKTFLHSKQGDYVVERESRLTTLKNKLMEEASNGEA